MKLIKNERGNGGIGLIGALGVAFVVLKLMGKIDWSWWWVTAPFWGGAGLVLAAIIFLFTCAMLPQRPK